MLKKRRLKSRPVCKVTFTLPPSIDAEMACVVGGFNDWDPTAHPMRRLKSGLYRVTIELEAGREYQFRYLVNNQEWHNDDQAERYVPNPFGSDNCVVAT